jgi:hypothetical protein
VFLVYQTPKQRLVQNELLQQIKNKSGLIDAKELLISSQIPALKDDK